MLYGPKSMIHMIWFVSLSLSRECRKGRVVVNQSNFRTISKTLLFLSFTLTFKECPSLWNSWCLGSSSRDFLIPRVPKTLNLVTFTGRLNIRYVTYHMSHMIAIIPGESSKNQLWRNVIVLMDWNGSSVTMERQINILILVISILAFH